MCHRTPLSGRFFFFADSSRFLIPLVSPGTGPDSFSRSRRPGFGFLKVYCRIRNCPNQLDPRATYHRMLGLIMLVLEVQVVWNRVLATLIDSRKSYQHIKLSPSLFLNAEGCALEGCEEETYQPDFLQVYTLVKAVTNIGSGAH